MKKIPRRRRSPHVPGQFLGYSLQTTRATVRLLQSEPGTFVSVEVLDDVAVVGPSGSTRVEQTKSATATNPISDRSPELWKTLANWIRAAQSKQIDPANTSFELFVSKKRRGPLAESLASAQDAESARIALANAKQTLWGPAPAYPKRKALSGQLAPHLDCVFGADLQLATAIVLRFSLSFGTGSSDADLENALRAKIISEDMLSTVANQMQGWVKSKLDSRIELSEPAIVSSDEFASELAAFVRKYDRFAILNSFAPEPGKPELDIEVQNRVYVRQLDVIGADYDTKLRAANDFLRASIDRSTWATKGLVHRSSFDELEDFLTRTWDAKRTIVSLQAKGRPPDECGKLLYSECSLVQGQLEGRAVPPHFTPGCYHALADSQTVGWHPNFKGELAALPHRKDSTG